MKYKGHLRKIDPETGEVDLEEGWITNNKFLYSDDGFQTVQSVYGKFTIDDVDYFGVLAKAVIAGYIEGSKIVGGDMRGGTIKIGQLNDGTWTFEVDEDGTVRMCGGDVVFSSNGHSSLKDAIDEMNGVQEIIKGQVDEINGSKMYRVEISTKDSQILKKSDQTAELSCKIYSWDREITNVYLTADGYPAGEEYGFDNKRYVDYARWKRRSNNTSADNTWNNDSEHIGEQKITITPADVAHNASFYCEVNIPTKPVITPTPDPEDDTNKTT